MAKLTLYHNPKCSTSNHALGVVKDAGVDADIVLYLKTPPLVRSLESAFVEFARSLPGSSAR